MGRARTPLPTKGLVAGTGKAPRKPPPAKDADREQRRLDVAARRVPAWQVSAVNALERIYNSRPAGGDEFAMYRQLAAILDSVPVVVRRAVELARAESRLR